MPAGGWYLLKSNGVSSLSCPRNSPLLWLWVKIMECVLDPTVFVSSGRIFQTEHAELICCSWWVPLGGTKGCRLRRNTSILRGWSAHKAEWITKPLGFVYGDRRPRLQSTGAQSWKMSWEMLFCLQRRRLHSPAGRESSVWDAEQSGGVRPFGVSFFCGWNEEWLHLFQSDPSGAYSSWKATAMGKNNANGKTFLEKDKTKSPELENAFSAAIVALRESFEGQIVEGSMEVGICNEADFRMFILTDLQAARAY